MIRNKKTGKLLDTSNLSVMIGPDGQYATIAEFLDNWEDAPEEDVKDYPNFEYWKLEGIKSELLGTTIAPEDYVAPNGKKYFTYDEAMELEEKVLKPNGWRLPTMKEQLLMTAEFGIDENGKGSWEVFKKNLSMELEGYVWDIDMEDYNKNPKNEALVRYRGVSGYWWSSTVSSATNAFRLYASAGRVIPQNSNNRGFGLTVRCVAR